MDWYHVPSVEGPGERIRLEGDEWRHAVRSSRHRAGDRVGIVDGEGGRGLAEVESVSRDRAVLLVEGWKADPREGAGPLALGVGLVPIRRFEWALEKGTEAGVHRFVPLLTGRAGPGLGNRAGRRLVRFREITRAAMKQSARSWWPRVDEPVSLETFLANEKGAHLLFGDQEGEACPADLRGPVAALVGPEGGWTPREREELLAAGARPVRVSSFRLRTETAAVLLAAAVAGCLRAQPRDGGPAGRPSVGSFPRNERTKSGRGS
jgi:16S rRNA (uracil1498-N3)-methyltransferase